jgi:hypothetical protein
MAKEITYYGQLQPTGVDNSMTKRLAALAGLADQVQDIAFQAGAERAQREGKRQGLTAGQTAAAEGQPLEKREGILSAFSIKDNAYNDAMEASYLASMQVDVQNDIARIAAENPLDSNAFMTLANESIKPRLQALQDPEVNAEATLFADQITSQYLRQIDQNTAKFTRESTDEKFTIAIAQQTSELIRASLDGDPAGIVVATQAITRSLNGRLGLNTISQAARDDAIRKTSVIAATAGYQGEIRRLANDGLWIKANELIDKLASESLEGFQASEQDVLIDTLRSDLNERAALDDRIEAEQAKLLAESRQETEANLFNGIMDGTTTGEDLRAAVRNPGVGGISINEYTRLKKVLSTDDVPDDFTVVAAISEIIKTDPAQAKVIITNNVGVNLSRTTAKSLYTTASNNLVGESYLNTSEAKRFSKYLENMIAPTSGFGLPGANEDARRWAQVKVVYDERVSAGENPAVVASELASITEEIENAKTLELRIVSLERELDEEPNRRDSGKTNEQIQQEIDALNALKQKSEAQQRFSEDLKNVLQGKKVSSQLKQEEGD